MIIHQNHHRTMEWHYDVTIEPIMLLEMIIISHRLHYSIIVMTIEL